MPDEFTPVGVPLARRGAGFEDNFAALRACWAADPVEHAGPSYLIPRAEIGPKPVNGKIPVLVGGNVQSAIERAARLGDGFAAVFLGLDATLAQIAWYREAGGAGPVVLRVRPERMDSDDMPLAVTSPTVIDDLARRAGRRRRGLL